MQIAETPKLLRQLHRVAERCLIFEDLPDETEFPILSRLFFGCHFWAYSQPFHTHLDRSRTEWRALLARTGFTIVAEYDVKPTTAIPYRRVGLLVQRNGQQCQEVD
jgi:hypothetical protein